MQPVGSVNGDVSEGESRVEEEGTYTGKEDVSAYLHEFQRLPSNYITTEEAEKLGFRSEEDNLEEVAPGKSIGGDPYENLNKMLPEEAGRTYKECDIDFDGTKRNSKRLIYSSDGLIFYTEDNCETFIQLY